MTIVNILLIFLNMFMFAAILWLKHKKNKKLVNLKEKHRQDLINYQAKLNAKMDYHKGIK